MVGLPEDDGRSNDIVGFIQEIFIVVLMPLFAEAHRSPDAAGSHTMNRASAIERSDPLGSEREVGDLIVTSMCLLRNCSEFGGWVSKMAQRALG